MIVILAAVLGYNIIEHEASREDNSPRSRRLPAMSSSPIAQRVRNCSFCGLKNCILHCSNCKKAFYCSSDCQLSHWPVHRDGCKKRR